MTNVVHIVKYRFFAIIKYNKHDYQYYVNQETKDRFVNWIGEISEKIDIKEENGIVTHDCMLNEQFLKGKIVNKELGERFQLKWELENLFLDIKLQKQEVERKEVEYEEIQDEDGNIVRKHSKVTDLSNN